MNKWCSKHVEDTKNWIKTLILKVCIMLVYITQHYRISTQTTTIRYLNKGWPTRWHLLYYILLNMFQKLIRPSSGASEYLLCCVGWIEACWCYVPGLSVGDVVSECRLNHYINIKMMHGPIRISTTIRINRYPKHNTFHHTWVSEDGSLLCTLKTQVHTFVQNIYSHLPDYTP